MVAVVSVAGKVAVVSVVGKVAVVSVVGKVAVVSVAVKVVLVDMLRQTGLAAVQLDPRQQVPNHPDSNHRLHLSRQQIPPAKLSTATACPPKLHREKKATSLPSRPPNLLNRRVKNASINAAYKTKTRSRANAFANSSKIRSRASRV